MVDQAIRRRYAGAYPWGTLLVNITGSALLGFLVGLPAPAPWTAFAGTGLCGALTTYSTFGYETVRLVEEQAWSLALANVIMSLVGGLGAAWGGIVLAAESAG